MLDQLGIDQPAWKELTSWKRWKSSSTSRLSGVGSSFIRALGRCMNVCYNEDELKEFLQMAKEVSKEYPVVVSQFMQDTKEIEFDAVRLASIDVQLRTSEHHRCTATYV